MISFACTADDLIFTEPEAAALDYRCPDCGADLDVLDDPENRTAEGFRREREAAKKPTKP